MLEVTRERLRDKTKTVAGVAVVGSKEYIHSFILKRHLRLTFHYKPQLHIHFIVRFVTVHYNINYATIPVLYNEYYQDFLIKVNSIFKK